MTPKKTYQINDLRAISETLEGETIIINLETGNYYSMNATGSVLWDEIGRKQPLQAICAHFTERYDASAITIEKAIDAAIEVLLKEQLILEIAGGEATAATAVKGTKEPFVAPTLEKYEDMQEMILADPIHDVDPMGWPNAKKGAA